MRTTVHPMLDVVDLDILRGSAARDAAAVVIPREDGAAHRRREVRRGGIRCGAVDVAEPGGVAAHAVDRGGFELDRLAPGLLPAAPTASAQADGDLIATTNTGTTFSGRWRVNSAETRMEIVIGGTEALEDLDDDDWRIDRLTNRRIRISAPDPDIVVFVRQS